MSIEDIRLISLFISIYAAVLSTWNFYVARSSRIRTRLLLPPAPDGTQIARLIINSLGEKTFLEEVIWKINTTPVTILKIDEVFKFIPMGGAIVSSVNLEDHLGLDSISVTIRLGNGSITTIKP